MRREKRNQVTKKVGQMGTRKKEREEEERLSRRGREKEERDGVSWRQGSGRKRRE